MTDRIKALEEALRSALNFIENTESELGIILGCGDKARAALAASQTAPDRIKALEEALRNIRELNMTGADENGHRWAHSDLIEQEIVFALAASQTAQPVDDRNDMIKSLAQSRDCFKSRAEAHKARVKRLRHRQRALISALETVAKAETLFYAQHTASMALGGWNDETLIYNARTAASQTAADCHQPELVTAQAGRVVAWRVRESPGDPWRYVAGDPERDPTIRALERQPLYAAPPAPTVQEDRRAEFEAEVSALLQAEVAAMQAECGPDVMRVAAEQLVKLRAGEAVKWPARCDGIEQDAFEAWAKSKGYDMAEHPLHWLFLNARTSAARHGWAAGLAHAVDRMRFPTPGAKVQAGQEPVALTYTNWRGETSVRSIIPRGVWFGSTEWHPEPQWLLRAWDTEKGAERDFALKDFGQPAPTVQEAARVLLAANLMDLIDGAMSDAIDETDEGTWVDEDRGACVGSAALANAWVAALRSIGGDA